ncbi:AbfB domain-containing protein [Streptomyces sp. NPDC050803]|uniref:AbfB domain-containing protein n=1 Tax=unclassified Streptomyces TaxID=2593676 RepID=UPI003423DD55
MFKKKPQPPQDRPWESGWAPDASRTPGTRRLWLAGGLALVTVVACVTAIAATQRPSDERPYRAAPSASASLPGLISFATPSASRPDRSTPPSAAPTPTRTHAKSPAPQPTSAAPKPDPKPDAKPDPQPDPKPTATWRSVRSVNYPDRSWQLSDDRVVLGTTPTRFQLVEGLADASCYSFTTADGTVLRHRDFALRAEHDDGTRLFEQDATFCPRASSHSGAIMLESVNYPGRYLRHQNFQLRLDPYQPSDLYRADSAFRLVA